MAKFIGENRLSHLALEHGEIWHDFKSGITEPLDMHLFPQKKSKSSIASIANLAKALDIAHSDLEAARRLSLAQRYTKKEIPKGNGGSRTVYDPCALIRRIQGRVNQRIFIPLVEWPAYLYGSLPNSTILDDDQHLEIRRDYVACAQAHCGSKSLVKFDISNFFENIHRDIVYDIFNGFLKFPKDVSEYLTDICCNGDFLLQGALTSSYIATLCLWDVEGDIVRKLRRRNLVYTRLVDDITISSKKRDEDFRHAKAYLIDAMLTKDLPLNDGKMEVLRTGIQPLIVHGLRVDYKQPRLAPGEIAKIKASVHNIRLMASKNNYRTSNSYRKQYDRCMGRVNKLARVGHIKHKVFLEKILKLTPLPSKVDIRKVRRAISRLNTFSAADRTTYRYKRIYGIALYRTGIIGRTFKKEQEDLLLDLRRLKP